ncbi:NAD-dependent protein deacetylase sirtuin-3, mitochondrial isoform X2 [Prionailurus viverrinus]|uniref:NAD-dependent protein deacetylase sirtuin-3, mitochondrial isoform X2 n=1 Tax=Prionailurus viverrinus TaxID=61388 RepID=UPI001FF54219|nr:NAD-dependent protein deacetylase sirtuin-3, mitochondrial isoform X2 [Prionailurus viverrinus]
MARWVRPALCALRLWGPAGWRSLYTEVRDVPGKGHQGPSPGRTDAVAASLWGVRKASCAVGLAALNSGSPRSGLYSNLQQYDLPYPEAIFELTFFHHNPKPFFALAKELHPGSYRPNVIHYFLRLLHDKGLLLRLYTQNIDGLERVAGIPASKLVEAHGSFASATCTVCRRPFPGKDVWDEVMVDRIPRCPVCTGIVKPDIVFFGETLPQRFLLHVVDFPMADVLLILGTSLEVEPFASLSEAVRSSVPRLLINRDLVGPFAWRPRSRDVVQLGDMVHSVERLVELLGWTEELRDLMRQEAEKLNGRDR